MLPQKNTNLNPLKSSCLHLFVTYLEGRSRPICWYCSALCWVLLVSVVRPLLNNIDGPFPNMSMLVLFTIVDMLALFTMEDMLVCFTSASEPATNLLMLAAHLSALPLRAIPSSHSYCGARGHCRRDHSTRPTGNHGLVLERTLRCCCQLSHPQRLLGDQGVLMKSNKVVI